MKFTEHMKAASDDLLRSGVYITTDTLVDATLARPGAVEAFHADAEQNLRSKALRDASKLLRGASAANDDPQVESLFDGTEYAPPRCITIKRDDEQIAHRAIEHAERSDCVSYRDDILEPNIAAALSRYHEFGNFYDSVRAELTLGRTVGDVLRARQLRDAA